MLSDSAICMVLRASTNLTTFGEIKQVTQLSQSNFSVAAHKRLKRHLVLSFHHHKAYIHKLDTKTVKMRPILAGYKFGRGHSIFRGFSEILPIAYLVWLGQCDSQTRGLTRFWVLIRACSEVQFACFTAAVYNWNFVVVVYNFICYECNLCCCKKGKKVKASHTRYRALGQELIPVYRQSARRWP